MAKLTLSSILTAFQSTATLNANFTAIVNELTNKVVYRDEVSPMERDFDMNSNSILNVDAITANTFNVSAYTAASASTLANARDINGVPFDGSAPIDVDTHVTAIDQTNTQQYPFMGFVNAIGDNAAYTNTNIQFNGTTNTLTVPNFAGDLTGTVDGIVGGNTPAAITGTTITANTQFSGAGTGLTGTAAGLTVGATTGVEAGADVTDTANVTAAGALMDSECASLADVKALNQSVVSGASPTFTATNFSGTAASLNIGGNAATATTASSVDDANVSFTDITTGNFSPSAHGFVPKAPAIPAGELLNSSGNWVAAGGGGDAFVGSPLSQFAATTSLQLKGTISDETGSGALVFATSPTLITPALGTPSSGVLTNCSGTAASLTAGTCTTVPSLTGDVSSSGNTLTIGTDKVTTAKILDDAVTYAKLQNATQTNMLLGRNAAGAGIIEEIPAATVLTGVFGINATAAELNLLENVVAGTRLASSALSVDGSGTLDALDVTTLTHAGSSVQRIQRTDPVSVGTGTTADITNVPSWAKRITLIYEDISTDGVSGFDFALQLGDATSFETTGYGCFTTNPTTSTITETTSHIPMRLSFVGTLEISGKLVLTLHDAVNNTWFAEGWYRETSIPSMQMVHGEKSLTGALTRLRLTMDGVRVFDNGTYSIMYEG